MKVAKRRCNFAALMFAGTMAVSSLAPAAETFADSLEAIRTKHQTPALAAAAFIDGKVVDVTAVGIRKVGDKTPVSANDLWHIGSCTKAMTSTLAAMVVEEGKLRWDSTVGEVFPEKRGTMNGGWAEVTLEQLLSHHAGAPGKAPEHLWAEAWKRAGTPRQQRQAFTFGLLKLPPDAPAGTKYIYSNQGYSIAGTMLEKTMNQPWEKMMKERLFKPLGMKSADFGAPGNPGRVDQPWGHSGTPGALHAHEPGPNADNPPSIGPGGTVHCSISDFARFAGRHALGARGPKDLLKNEGSWTKLHTPAEGQKYAFGWGISKRDWANGTTLSHNGSNTMWFAVMWVAPERGAAFVAATNTASEGAEQACDDAVAALISRHLKGN